LETPDGASRNHLLRRTLSPPIEPSPTSIASVHVGRGQRCERAVDKKNVVAINVDPS
jgi:hypothetical protein